MKKSILIAVVSTFTFFSCSTDTDTAIDTTIIEPNPTTPVTDGVSVKLANNATFGNIITDAAGKSLYFFSKDADGNSACSGGCANAWPIFYTKELKLDAGLEMADFGVITRADGTKQNTFKGWPLYYYAGDSVAGDTAGDKVGNNWYIAKPDYSIMYAQAQLVGKDANGNAMNLKSDYTPGDELTFYLTNGKGRTIYTFTKDRKDTNNYTDQAFTKNPTWPILEFDVNMIPSILDRADFGTIDVFGRTQVTYKGHPLYYFIQDTKRGDNFGVNVPAPGVWPIANADTAPAPSNL